MSIFKSKMSKVSHSYQKFSKFPKSPFSIPKFPKFPFSDLNSPFRIFLFCDIWSENGGFRMKFIVVLPVTVHVRKLCSTCTVRVLNVVMSTSQNTVSSANSALIHYLVVINFVILSNNVIQGFTLFNRFHRFTPKKGFLKEVGRFWGLSITSL